MKRYLLPLAGFAVTLATLPNLASAAEPPREHIDFFEKKVRPILADNCYSCHNLAQNKKKGNLTLDSRAGLLKGGDIGPALVPGKPEQSLLIKAVKQTDKEIKMPPKGKLTAEQVATLEHWIALGAPWPGASSTARLPGKITDEDRAWWAFQPLTHPKLPDVDDKTWTTNPIDRFIYQKLKTEGLQPAPAAAPDALVRRIYFDLIGLPPTAEEIAAFRDSAFRNPHSALEDLVDRLLASPRYGERWARHWLDLVRYAESDGFRLDEYRPEAWRYRDYVIKSFNADKPYDRFVQEQLAGDELWPGDPDALTATGFLRHWIYEYNQRDVRTQWDNIQNDLTDTTGDVFLGLGLGCARCHDHKFDPILQKDYYRMQAFFAPILPRDNVPLATPQQLAEHRNQRTKWEALTADIRKELDQLEAPHRHRAAEGAITKFPDEIQAMIRKPVSQRTPLEHQLAELAYRQITYEFERIEGKLKDEQKLQLIALKKKLTAHDPQRPAPLPHGLTVTDAGPVAPPTFIPKKPKLGAIEPGYLTLLDEKPAAIAPVPTAPNSTGRRTALARWITRSDNPLATRVIVNRVWQYHFGQGLVPTASDFGRLGEKPSHPDLLDYLVSYFVASGGRESPGDAFTMKKLHRLIVTSQTYRQSAFPAKPQAAQLKDPENRLLWRGTTRRLDAEQIRDTILTATGELDLTAGGPSADLSKPRRSVYCRWTRNTRDPLLDVFDLPEGFVSTAQRNATTTPTQSLLMINSPYMLARARALAGRLEKGKYADDAQLVEAAFRLMFNRVPSAAERDRTVNFLRDQGRRAQPTVVAGTGFQSEKMQYREGRAAVMTPGTGQARFEVADNAALPTEQFTIEAFVLLRSTYEDAGVRPIAGHWSGDRKKPGWSFGVTSKKSRFKPQNLVLQLFGDPDTEDAIFSGLHIGLNKPYYVAVSVNLKDPEQQGITFYAKDLSNDEEPLQIARCGHKTRKLARAEALFTIGGHGNQPSHTWDGLIDDVRLSSAVIDQAKLMLNAEGTTDKTIAYWQFEQKPGVYKDSTGHGHDIKVAAAAGSSNPRFTALVDLCHVLLNANEFLYVD